MDSFNFKKKFGQNFLVDTNVVRKIVSDIDVKPNSLVIEVGCGDGRLTKFLCEKFDHVLGYEIDLDVNDFQLQFVRNESANIQSKAQACGTMLGFGMSPELAFAKSGISSDPVSDVAMSKKYLDLRWGDPTAKQQTLDTKAQVSIDQNNTNKQPQQTEEKLESGNYKDGYEAKWDKGQNNGIKYNKDK